MNLSTSQRLTTVAETSEALVMAALRGDAREGITNLLQEIAAKSNSFGCVLWRATIGANPPLSGELTMLASYFAADKSHFGLKFAPFEGTIAGKAAVFRKGWHLENDLVGHHNPNSDKPFFTKHSLNRVAACRFRFLGGPQGIPGRLGVVMIFRRKNDPEYTESEDIPYLQEVARILPYLYSGAHQKASYGLLKEVGTILSEARAKAQVHATTSKADKNKILRKIVSAISDTFHAMEVSVFLEDAKKNSLFTCAMTTEGYHTDLVKAVQYEPRLDNGFSSLALYSRESIRVHDLLQPDREIEEARKRFPTFSRPQQTTLAPVVLEGMGNPNPPPPLSMMVAPLVSDGALLGFLRCWVARSGPAYFSSDDLELLGLVGDYLSQTLAAWQHERATAERRKREHIAFKDLARTAQSVGKERDDTEIYMAALPVIGQIIPEAAFNTIRLRRVESNFLSFLGYVMAPNYVDGARDVSKELRQLGMPMPGIGLTGIAIKQRKVRVFRGAMLGRYPTDVAHDAGELIVAPILLNDEVEGVIDLRTRKGERFHPQAIAAAESISSFLSLQLGRDKAEADRRKADIANFNTRLETDREKVKNELALRDAFEDVFHQLKSPLVQAARSAEVLMANVRELGVKAELDDIGSLLRRAEMTAKLLGLFASLAKGESRRSLSTTALDPKDFLRIVSQVCNDQSRRISPYRGIRLSLDSSSVVSNVPIGIRLDRDLLYHAINNLVDNAVKYSFSETSIKVTGGRDKRGSFVLSVTNRGIPIEAHEVNLVRQRNWRGPRAESMVGEGNGLGLWIVDNIMRAHGGELIVIPTRPTGFTEIRLIFRIV